MMNAHRALVVGGAAALVYASVLAAPADTRLEPCRAQALKLEQPAYMVVDAVVRGERLLLPDYTRGLREVDLRTGRDLRSSSILPMGTQQGEVTGPQHLGCGSQRCVVFGDRYFWVFYDTQWRFLHEYPGFTSTASGQPLVFEDRIIVYGIARSEATAGGTSYLYVQYDDGEILPLQEFPSTMPFLDIVKHIQFQGIITGGLTALDDGGWVFVDPRSYSVYVFDSRDRLTRAWRGTNPRYRVPNWAAAPEVHDDSGRETYARWQLAQPLVKRPVLVDKDLLAVVVGLPNGPLRQRHELDLYRLSGDPVAIGVPISGVEAGRLIAADADDGRLVLVGQESWEPSATTTVWRVDVPTISEP